MKNVATFKSGNKEIWDYRNLPILTRIKLAWALVIYGIVDIQWGKANFINLGLGERSKN